MVIFRKDTKDWKEFLRKDAQILLSELAEVIKKHKAAYTYANDVKAAQIWCGLIEIKRELREINERLKKLEDVLHPILEVSEEEKKKTIMKLVEEALPSAEKEKKEKIVESLMKL